MKRITTALMLCLLAALTACSKVPAGNVGVIVNLYGSEKGVELKEVGTGRYWVGVNEDLYLFPTFTQTETWSGDNAITFQTIEGMKVGGDVGITYSVAPDKVSALFQKYRAGIDEITNKFLRNMVRDAFNDIASKLPVESVYGAGKSDLLLAVEKRVREQVAPIGLNVERIYYASDLVLPPQVTQSLNAKIQATQMAEQRRNEVAQAKAEADKERARAQGEADAKLTLAQADAKAIEIRAQALRANPDVVTLNAVEKWDGKLPQYMAQGSPLPFIGVGATK
ncbi:SPFH domain-containing protein [Pseudomonas nitroreducens]|uniref:SPFH domain-containing protein n=1 Tax=Pseudomonas nitroreducens TaxID=46680 RepID=UPI003CC81F98